MVKLFLMHRTTRTELQGQTPGTPEKSQQLKKNQYLFIILFLKLTYNTLSSQNFCF